MNKEYKGVIIEESLENKEVFKEVSILGTRVEVVTEKHETPWLKQWTLHTVKVPQDQADNVAEKISRDLDSEHAWYADFKNDKLHYVIFKNKIFKIDLSSPKYREAMEYGITLGIPWHQLDFSPEIEEWKR